MESLASSNDTESACKGGLASFTEVGSVCLTRLA